MKTELFEYIEIWYNRKSRHSYLKNLTIEELKAFAKTKELKAGESQLVTLNVAVADLASYDESISSWLTEKGNYLFHLSASSRDVRTTVAAEVAEGIVVKTNDVLKTQERINLLKP